MSAQPLELRMAQIESSMSRLGGAYDQIDKRLGDLRADVIAGFARLDQRLDSLDRKMDEGYRLLDRKIDEGYRLLDRKIDEGHRLLDRKIDEGYGLLDRKIGLLDRKIGLLDHKIDGNLKTLIGWMLGQTGVIVGAIAAVAFALRH